MNTTGINKTKEEYLDDSSVYRSLKCELDQGRKAAVVTLIDDREGIGEHSRKMILTEEQLLTPGTIHNLDTVIARKAKFALETGKLQYFRTSKGSSIIIEPYFPRPRLVVLGGGHIAKPLAEFGAKVGFSVTVVDDRPMFANKDRFPDAENVICEGFNHCFAQFNLNESSFVVIVTRGHRHDLDCLKQALNQKTAYIGMIGSKRRVNSFREQLLKEDYPEELIQTVMQQG